MNLQQKKYTIERLIAIAQKASQTYAYESNDMHSTYLKETCITVQTFLANDRELLMTLPIREGLDVDASANHALYYIFETAELQRSLEEKHALIAPDVSVHEGRVFLTPKAEPVVLRYRSYLDKFNQLKADLTAATDSLMLGSSEDELISLQSFESKYG